MKTASEANDSEIGVADGISSVERRHCNHYLLLIENTMVIVGAFPEWPANKSIPRVFYDVILRRGTDVWCTFDNPILNIRSNGT